LKKKLNFNFTSGIKIHKTTMQTDYATENALKAQISKEHSRYLWEKEYTGYVYKALFKAWAKTIDVDAVWEFLDENERTICVRWNSKELGIKTQIKEYTTKTGRKFMAHYTINGKYLKTVKKDDDEEDRYYTGFFPISREYFDIDFKLKTELNQFSDFLKPKKQNKQPVANEPEPKYTIDEEEMIKELASELLEHGATMKDLKEQMECAEIPYYKKLVKSIIENL
jgi:hypothetical protein